MTSSSEAGNRRTPQPLNQQLPTTARWAASLPDEVQPLALLQSLPRIATVRAVGRTRLVAIRSGELLMKIRRDPTFAFELLQRMSSQQRQ